MEACPAPEILDAFVHRRTDEETAISVSVHLTRCDACYETVAAEARLSWSREGPEWPLLPALVTAVVLALALTAALFLLLD